VTFFFPFEIVSWKRYSYLQSFELGHISGKRITEDSGPVRSQLAYLGLFSHELSRLYLLNNLFQISSNYATDLFVDISLKFSKKLGVFLNYVSQLFSSILKTYAI
jgi:hypothetical protein